MPSSRTKTGERHHEPGIIDELTTAAELVPRVLARAGTLSAIPHATYALTKKQLHRP